MKRFTKILMTTAFSLATILLWAGEVTLNVKTSNGDPLAGVQIRYNNFGNNFAILGTTDANGNVVATVPDGTWTFRAVWNSSIQNVSGTSPGTVNFQTALATGFVKDCQNNNPLSGFQIRYNNFGANTIPMGNTDASGKVSFELFPGTYNISAVINSTTSTKSLVLTSTGGTVEFNPTRVCFTYSGQVRYNNFGTNTVPFACNSYLFPGTYNFKFGGTSAPNTSITISGCVFTGAQIRLVDENNAPLANFNGSYRSRCGGSWTYNNVAFTTDANGFAFINTSCASNNWDGNITVNVNKTSKEQVVATNSIYQLAKVVVNLKTCVGAPLAGANVEQGSGSWTPRGTTDANGQNSYYAFPGNNVVARLRYNYGTQTISGVPVALPVTNIDFTTTKVTLNGAAPIKIQVSGWPTVTFPMEMLPGTYGFRFNGKLISGVVVSGCEFNRTLLQVKNESNGPVAGATFIPACGGSWQPQLAGATDANGCLFAEVPACMTKIKTNVGSSSQELTAAQLATSGYTYITQVLRINFINAAGTPITDGLGTIQSGGGWPTIGSFNASGYFDVNSFPATTGFRATYNNTTEQKNFTIVAGAGIQQETFQTGQVFGACITQYAGAGWSTFVDGMELMPGTRNFRYPTQSGTVVAGAITNLTCPSPTKTDFEAGTAFIAYPNPATETVSFLNFEGNFEVYNTTGQLMYSGNAATINIADWQSGLYVVRTQDQVIKFVKK